MAGKILYVLTGPSAVGKTGLAMDWAEANHAEILSCDSLLVYRGMDIGTAKPTREQMRRVRHHGIDVVSVQYRFTVKDYLAMALEAVEDILRRKKKVLVTGGSGFYLKGFFSPVADETAIPSDIRQRVRKLLEADGLEGALGELRQLNPEGLGSLDINNPRRVTKALERCLTTGKTVIALKEEFEAQPHPFKDYGKKVCLLEREPDDLKERVGRRVRSMLANGLLDETRRLLDAGLENNPSAASAIGYRESIAYIREGGRREELEAAIAQNTMRLIKKQRTWFRGQIPVKGKLLLGRGEKGRHTDLFGE